MSKTSARGRGGMADAADVRKLECSLGNRRCRTAQSRGNLIYVAIPSQAWREISRDSPDRKPDTESSYSIRAAKAVVGKKIRKDNPRVAGAEPWQ
jgi:hypothetical protein